MGIILYECGICDHLHPWDWDGDCREDSNRYAGVDHDAERKSVLVDEIEVRDMCARFAGDVGKVECPWHEEDEMPEPVAPRIPIDRTHLDVWAERDRTHIALREDDGSQFKDGPIIAQWWDEDAQQMFEDGFFSTKGMILGRLIDPRPLHTSVYAYCRDHDLLPEDPTAPCNECGVRLTRKRMPKDRKGITCLVCVEEWRKNNPEYRTSAEWRSWLRSAKTFQEV